jgi:hypothetical protein
MKSILIVAILAFACLYEVSARAATSGAVEIYFEPDAAGSHPSAWASLSHSFDKHGLGLFAFGFIMEGWSELRVGPTWAPAKWVQLGLSVGVEFMGTEAGVRFGSSAWFGYKAFSFAGTVEFTPRSFQGNNSGTWFDLTPMYRPLEWLAVGAKYRRGVGVGPLLEFATPTSPAVAFWCAWMPVEPEGTDGDMVQLTRFLTGVQGRF